MASLIPGYEYDIFISYRQKDNQPTPSYGWQSKGDRWVSEFVEALKTELESTFKEEISVYFDINPHDGLLETHDVDASLKDKLKCLVFIPIISRTYCDPKAFAWEHEFKAFVEEASKDQFGFKVKLPNGNVATRVLPVRIYELDSADIKLCESALGGVLRGVEFIYAEPGVNRPLKPDDDEKINLNKTRYRNQINKVGNAIKEIISGLKTEPEKLNKEKIQHGESSEYVNKEKRFEVRDKPVILLKRKLFTGSIILVSLLIIASILAYPKIFKLDTLEKLKSSGERISVAVMPFQNMTNDTTWNVWQNSLQTNIINYLSNSKELKIFQYETINSFLQSKNITNYSAITPSIASSISQKLDAHLYINGSINQAGSTIRLNAQLIDTKANDVLKSFKVDGTAGNILVITDSLSWMLRNFLLVSKLEKQITPEIQRLGSTSSPEAYRYYLNGMNALFKADWPAASSFFLKSLDIDSNFYLPKLSLPFSYGNRGMNEEAGEWCLKVYRIKDQLSLPQKTIADFMHAYWFETPYEEIKYLKQYHAIDDQSPNWFWHLGYAYYKLQQYDKAITEMEKALELFDKWGVKPFMFVFYTFLGDCYHQTGQYNKEKQLYMKAEKDLTDDWDLNYREVILSLTEKDTVSANLHLAKLKSIWREIFSMSEAEISVNKAYLYSEAGIPDKAENYFREALSSAPEDLGILNSFAYFLIDKNRDISEGMRFIDKALALTHEIKPDQYYLLHTRGWGLYKQGRYQEALESLQKSWDIKSIYDHGLFLHLEAAKKAVAEQKNN